jgi:PKD repeat protein
MKYIFTVAIVCIAHLIHGQNDPKLMAILKIVDEPKIISIGDIVKFKDESTGGPTSREWQFSNGNPTTSMDKEPSVKWETSGMFIVTLKVKKGTDSASVQKTIIVGPHAAFTTSARAVNVGSPVSFTNSSIGTKPMGYLWSFSGAVDSIVDTKDVDSVSWAKPGTYKVTLLVISQEGRDSVTETIFVIPPQINNTQLNEINAQLDQIRKIVSENSDDANIPVGTLSVCKWQDVEKHTVEKNSFSFLKSSKKKKSSNSPTKIPIDSVCLQIQDGCILNIQVYSKGIKFTNKRAPIEISTRRFSQDDKLFSTKISSEYIILNEILCFDEKDPALPDDESSFLLTPKEPSRVLYKAVGINSVLDVALYTDALGTFVGKPNALIQTDVGLKQTIHRRNFRNSSVYMMNYFKINVGLSKFDSKVAYTDTARFSRSTLYQRSWFVTDVQLTLLNGRLQNKEMSRWYIDGGGGFFISNIAATLDTFSAISTYYFLQPGFNFSTGNVWGVGVYGRFTFHHSPQTDLYDPRIERTFLRIGGHLYWCPVKSPASKIFTRINYTVDPRDKKKQFVQWQIGYSIKLSSVISKK